MPESIVDDSQGGGTDDGDPDVSASAAPSTPPTPAGDPEAAETPPEDSEAPAEDEETSADDDEPMSMAQARKLRRENQQLRERMKADRERIAEIDRAAMSDHERAIEAAREETAAEYKGQMAAQNLALAAKGKLRNPEDASVFIEASDPDADFEAQIDELLESRPYLGLEGVAAPAVDQGARRAPQPKGKSLGDLMRESKGKGTIRL